VLTVVLVAAAWVVVGWLPGYLLVDALRPAAGWLRNAALAPMAALGLTMIAGQGLQILRVRDRPVDGAAALDRRAAARLGLGDTASAAISFDSRRRG